MIRDVSKWSVHPLIGGVTAQSRPRASFGAVVRDTRRSTAHIHQRALKGRAASLRNAVQLPDLLDTATPDAVFEEQHAFSLLAQPSSSSSSQPLRLAHWLIPRRVLLGRYPFIHRQNNNRQHAEHQIQTLLQSGVTTFVCLQAELPPQCHITAGGCGGFFAYKPVATMLHSSMTGQPDIEVTASIRNRHLDQFLPQKRSKSQSSSQSPADSDLQFLHFPIQDLSIPEENGVNALITDLISRVERGEILYLHCWGGRGRAGTIGACMLKAMYGIDGDEALARVQRSFDTRRDVWPDLTARQSPETEEQRNFVRDFKFAQST